MRARKPLTFPEACSDWSHEPHQLLPGQQGVFSCLLAKNCSFLWDKVDYKNRAILQKQGRDGFLAVGTCLAKFVYDLDLDESWQFLSHLGLNAFNFPSLPSPASVTFPEIL